jgi:hypothetical protein
VREQLSRQFGGAGLGDADRDRDVRLAGTTLGDRKAQALGHAGRARPIAVDEQRGDLLAADPGDRVERWTNR